MCWKSACAMYIPLPDAAAAALCCCSILLRSWACRTCRSHAAAQECDTLKMYRNGCMLRISLFKAMAAVVVTKKPRVSAKKLYHGLRNIQITRWCTKHSHRGCWLSSLNGGCYKFQHHMWQHTFRVVTRNYCRCTSANRFSTGRRLFCSVHTGASSQGNCYVA